MFGIILLAGCAKQETSMTPEPLTGEVSAKISDGMDLVSIVKNHSDEASCWTVISGSVYDLTSFIGKHPGGDKAILASCGKDATEMFDQKHGMDPKKWEGLMQFKVMIK
ncbi:TPA: hypothetical protein DEP21_00305 [Patescibacteria group bacterium]|nr:hypothetical protein [Candidatus Gracilibacteria bacterium]